MPENKPVRNLFLEGSPCPCFWFANFFLLFKNTDFSTSRETRKMGFASSLLRGVGAAAEPHLLTWFTKLRSVMKVVIKHLKNLECLENL
jgi:hypothetical protein